MNTIIYLIRHSQAMKMEDYKYEDSLQLKNEKNVLSVEGERKAKILSKIDELKNIDIIFSSSYARAMSTAKYIANENNLNIFIDEEFGERKFGINNWDEKPQDFEQKQFEDIDYKIGNGESLREVGERTYNELMKIVELNENKRIVIVSHATAITNLFRKIGELKQDGIYINNQLIIPMTFKFNAPELFKLEFEGKKLINIENIRNINY